MKVKRLIKLINDERKDGRLVSAKAQNCTGHSTDTCNLYVDNATCTINSYDVCGKDYAGCYNYSYDYCAYIDNTACGDQGHDITK